MVTLHLLLFVLALVLFAVAAYLTADVPTKLTRLALALIVLAWMV